MKACPACAESVQDEARICRFCGHSFTIDGWKATNDVVKWIGGMGLVLIALFLLAECATIYNRQQADPTSGLTSG